MCIRDRSCIALKKYNEAINYFNKCLPLILEEKNDDQIAGIFSNIGISYHAISDFDNAINNLNTYTGLTSNYIRVKSESEKEITGLIEPVTLGMSTNPESKMMTAIR